jgi:hypothetical protein
MSDPYRDEESPLPPVGTRVIHALHGPAVIARDREEFGQWFIRFDQPFRGDGGRTVEDAWCYPSNLSPAP